MKVRIKNGKSHGAFKQYRGGDELDVTAAELLAFRDKFEVIDDTPVTTGKPILVRRKEFAERVVFDASSMRVRDVLKAVEKGTVSAKVALESELAGLNRKTLVKKLTAME